MVKNLLILLLFVFAVSSFSQSQCLREIGKIESSSEINFQRVDEFHSNTPVSLLNNLQFKAFKNYEKNFLFNDEFLLEIKFATVEISGDMVGYVVEIEEYYSEDSKVRYLFSENGNLLKFVWFNEGSLPENVCEGVNNKDHHLVDRLSRDVELLRDNAPFINNFSIDQIKEELLDLGDDLVEDYNFSNQKDFVLYKNIFAIVDEGEVVAFVISIASKNAELLGKDQGVSYIIDSMNLEIIESLQW